MASPLRWTDENGGVPSRPQHLRYPCPAKRPTDALEESKYSKLEPRNPGSALIAPAWSGLPICSREVPEWILPCSHIVTIYSFQSIFLSYRDLWAMYFWGKKLQRTVQGDRKKNWNVATKAMCKLYWIASTPDTNCDFGAFSVTKHRVDLWREGSHISERCSYSSG